jgi:hypothetical protein
MIMPNNKRPYLLVGLIALCFFISTEAALGDFGDYRDDIGYTRLLAENPDLPDGGGLIAMQNEAASGGSWMPETSVPPTDPQFIGKTINPATSGSSGESSHARAVGYRFYGIQSSMAPGIPTINVYEANDWIFDGFLHTGESKNPEITANRVGNHSWVGSASAATAYAIMNRLDWVVDVDEMTSCVGMANTSTVTDSLLRDAFNVIAVGVTSNIHNHGTVDTIAPYLSGRTKPEIVAPESLTSYATPLVASAAALLIASGHADPLLSADPVASFTTNRNGDLIYNAERSEVIKAALMAGADRQTNNTVSTANITDYRAAGYQTDNGLDARFGAGQLNIYNSYHIIAAGEQNSKEDEPAGSGYISNYGFDYDPHFGGNGGSNATASYYFTTSQGNGKLAASLVWHLDNAGGNVVHDLNLALYQYDNGWPQQPVALSASTIENTENLWVTNLAPDTQYMIQVQANENFNWDYSLAWRIESESDAVPAMTGLLVIPAASIMIWLGIIALKPAGSAGKPRFA